MIEDFLLLKLNRTVWVALLAQNKIVEAVSYYETYRNNLAIFQNNKQLKEPVLDEAAYSQAYFLNKITTIAEKYIAEKDYANAAICYTAIFKYNQNNINDIKNYILCLEKLDQFDLATEVIKHLETTTPNDISVYKLLSEIYNKQNNNYKSVQYMEKYLAEKTPDKISASEYNLLGCYYNKLYSDNSHKYEDIVKSLNNFKKASDIEPFNKLFMKNATIMASKANDYQSGKYYWDEILKLDNMSNDDKYDYAAFCLKNQDFEGWYKYFNARFAKENNPTQFPKISKPEWNGIKNISGYTLLVHYEQGFGDTFLTWGYIPRLVKLAKHVIFVCQDNIYELLKDNPYGVEVIPKSLADFSKIKFDYYIPSMTIPIALKLNRENISVGEGYIKANPELVKEFKEKYFNNDKFKIGISFAGSINGNHTRDILIENFLPLDKLNNIEIYSLTKDISDSKFECFKNNRVQNIAKDFKNFAETAAAIENLDLVLTSDNCILNLAGALGKKTLALFNWHYEFRWFDLSGKDVVWLTSVEPIVNDKIDNWSYSINKAIEKIEALKK